MCTGKTRRSGGSETVKQDKFIYTSLTSSNNRETSIPGRSRTELQLPTTIVT